MQVLLIIGFIVAVMVPLYLLTTVSLPLLVFLSLVLSLVLISCLQVMVGSWAKNRPGGVFWTIEQLPPGCRQKRDEGAADAVAYPCCEKCGCPEIEILDQDPAGGPGTLSPAGGDDCFGLCNRCGHRGRLSSGGHRNHS